MWILGLLSSGNSSPSIPKSVRVIFCCFSDISNPGSYTTPDSSQQPKGKNKPSHFPQFIFTEWWNIGEGETMRKPYNVCDEIVVGLLHAIEMVSNSLHLHIL